MDSACGSTKRVTWMPSIRWLTWARSYCIWSCSQPPWGRAAKGFGQADGHFQRNAGMAVQQEGQRLTADAQSRRSLRDRELQRLDGQVTDDLAGVRGILHGHGFGSSQQKEDLPHAFDMRLLHTLGLVTVEQCRRTRVPDVTYHASIVIRCSCGRVRPGCCRRRCAAGRRC